MAKASVAKPNAPQPVLGPPFMPPVYTQHPPSKLGLTDPWTGPREDGCYAYTNYDAVTPVRYAGQNQTSTINQTFRP